ncbi:sterol desaturase family protein [Chitinophaga polysaccharea]|uniref:sterol desaturase family protein n=1 Tax=Chitinophaga polysaccharea TaxID=1293035 RepID=UPI001159D32F|nr:sterol desaturase family protein [Chitinophaga polysaccharea]
MNIMEALKQITAIQLILLSIVINLFLFFLSVGCYMLFSRFSRNTPLQGGLQKVTSGDIRLSVLVTGCNALVFIVGYSLWQRDILSVGDSTNVLLIIMEVIFLVIAMDFLMYIFHRVAHLPLFYKLFHLRHHQHESTNAISLFVLHPVEALGFGGLFVLVLFIYPFSYPAISIYLFINLLWGTIGHLDKEILPKRISVLLQSGFLGTTRFHNDHHKLPHYNYGFYTVLWDRIFGTLFPGNTGEKADG